MTDLKYGFPAHLIGTPDENGCERWLGGHTGKGYGAFQGSYVHRLVYTNVNGLIPEGLQVDHSCHVRDCVNPAHLRLATNQQNGRNRAGAQVNSESGIRGVCWHKGAKMWHVQVTGAEKSYYFHSIEEAEDAAIVLRNHVYGKGAEVKINDFPDQGRPGYIVVNASMAEDRHLPVNLGPDEYLIVRDCTFCGKGTATVVPAQGLWDWEHGTFIQTAMPNLTPGEREQVMTGTHDACYDKFMKDE